LFDAEKAPPRLRGSVALDDEDGFVVDAKLFVNLAEAVVFL
jgi:hypothetical protein